MSDTKPQLPPELYMFGHELQKRAEQAIIARDMALPYWHLHFNRMRKLFNSILRVNFERDGRTAMTDAEFRVHQWIHSQGT